VKALAIGVAVQVLGGAAHAPRLAGCAIFPADNPWNTRVDSLPVASNSDAIIASIGAATGLHPDFGSGKWAGGPIGIPYDVVDGTKIKKWTKLKFRYADESDPGPYPIPKKVHTEHGSDRHALILETSTCKLYELFGLKGKKAGSGAIWSLSSNALRPDGRTAGRRPTPPGCPSSPAWPATTRSPRARSTTLSASPSSTRARHTSGRPATTRAR